GIFFLEDDLPARRVDVGQRAEHAAPVVAFFEPGERLPIGVDRHVDIFRDGEPADAAMDADDAALHVEGGPAGAAADQRASVAEDDLSVLPRRAGDVPGGEDSALLGDNDAGALSGADAYADDGGHHLVDDFLDVLFHLAQLGDGGRRDVVFEDGRHLELLRRR